MLGGGLELCYGKKTGVGRRYFVARLHCGNKSAVH